MPLAGNSIGTDRRFLATELPAIEDFLNYRSVDVSTIKELCRRWLPDVYKAAPTKLGGHRALQDIREEVVIAIPPPLVVERNHKQIATLERLQHRAAVLLFGDSVT